MKRTIENVTNPQEKVAEKEVVNIDEETETDEEPEVIVMRSIAKSVSDRVKDKKKLKVVTPKYKMRNAEKVKHKYHIKRPLKKKKKFEEKVDEKKSLKIKLVQTTDAETDQMS